MTEIESFRPQDGESPFDAIRQVREDGSEFWSARDLMPLLGYATWERFTNPLERAIQSSKHQKTDWNRHFVPVVVRTAGRPKTDYELSWYGVLIVSSMCFSTDSACLTTKAFLTAEVAGVGAKYTRRSGIPGMLYVIKRSDGSIKVGRSSAPQQRIRQHAREGGATQVHITKHSLNSDAAEKRAHADIQAIGTRLNGEREVFVGIEFGRAASISDAAVAAMRSDGEIDQ